MEIVKSEVITVASCSVQNKALGPGERTKKTRKGVRFHGHEKWTPVHDAGGTTARFHTNHSGNKIWRFKNISFPWLPRPSKRTAYDDGRGNKKSKITTKTKGQGRVLRTNSAPKTLGLEFRERQMDRNAQDLSDVEERDGTASEQVKAEKIEQATLHPPLAMDPWKRRRVSLPDFGADARRLRESGTVGISLRDQCCLTPNSNRKKFLPVQQDATVEDKHNIREENNYNGHKQKRSSLEQVIDTRKLSDSAVIRKTVITAEGKPRSHSLDIPDVRVLSLDENSNNNIPSTKISSQNDVEDIEQPSIAHKSSHKCFEVKKVTNPDIFFVPIPAEENLESYNDDEDEEDDDDEARLSSSEPALGYLSHPEIRHPADLMPLNITIQEIMRAELQDQLEMREFSVDLCQEWCKEICQSVKRRVQELRRDLYKVVCVMYIGALRGHGVHASVQCLWSPQDDNFTAVSYKNHSLFAIASVLAMKYE